MKKFKHNLIHLSLTDYINKCAKKCGWIKTTVASDGSGHLGNNHTYNRYERNREDCSSKEYLEWIVKSGFVELNKTSSDGFWHDESSTYYLVDPDSLEKIKTYFK